MNDSKKIHFNVIDIIVIFLVIACVLGLVFRAEIREKLGKALSGETAYITLVAENVPYEHVKAFVQGNNA